MRPPAFAAGSVYFVAIGAASWAFGRSGLSRWAAPGGRRCPIEAPLRPPQEMQLID